MSKKVGVGYSFKGINSEKENEKLEKKVKELENLNDALEVEKVELEKKVKELEKKVK